jgi:hypothetical protein
MYVCLDVVDDTCICDRFGTQERHCERRSGVVCCCRSRTTCSVLGINDGLAAIVELRNYYCFHLDESTCGCCSKILGPGAHAALIG